MVRLNPDGTFAERPQIGERFLHLGGDVFTVAASWADGVVFEGGKPCSAVDLVDKFDPQCPACKAFHEPEYPHELFVRDAGYDACAPALSRV